MAGGRAYRTKAIVLDKTKLKETDLILTLLAEDGKQLRAVGKGARKPGSRLAARCELGCEVDLLLARGRALDVVAEANLIEAPLGAAPSFELLSSASALADVAKACTFEDACDPFVFQITRRALEVLGGGSHAAGAGAVGAAGGAGAAGSESLDGPHLDLVVAAYIFKLLAHLGYRPDYTSCVACGDPDVTFFSATAGGLLCASCASSVPGAEPLDTAMVGWLHSLMVSRFDVLADAPCDEPTATFLLALAHIWAATHLDCRLRALEFLLGV